jgi:hypothetical protein
MSVFCACLYANFMKYNISIKVFKNSDAIKTKHTPKSKKDFNSNYKPFSYIQLLTCYKV